MLSPTRRTFLALGTFGCAQLVCGCSGGSGNGQSGDQPHPDPDQALRARAVTATDTLLAAYDALLAGPGSAQADRLKPLRADLVTHRAALAKGLPSASASASASVSVSASAGATKSASRGASPSRSAAASASASASASAPTRPPTVAALAAAERQTAGGRLGDLLAASPALAKLLAAVSASDALHATALGDTGPIAVPLPAPTSSPSPSPSPSPSLSPSPSRSRSASGSASPTPSATASTSASATKAPLPSSAVNALQAALAAEHAAVYGYGVIGGHLPAGPQHDDGRASYTAHQARRDAWQRLLTTDGATPAAAAPGYQLPFAVATPASAGDLAVHIEAQLTAVYADLVEAATGPLRLDAAAALREAALNARHWGGNLPALPGLPAADNVVPSA
ncbi:ferritin-like domain-containing protein [Kitasatospora sp. MAP5-34]|uniref:ferritin-like domain-containing protein n=1 Tax=Kitasatospora sp. MAP5-34 TaxID=3035102 RepID=UPI00247427A4|nr:ferritin-like domain-containing protein [Kitasatospora sp. MAP5-34]MDH6579666.1 hypothetical protein [Kitasatospora sp. MAP5-34]